METIVNCRQYPYSHNPPTNYAYIGRPSKWGNPFKIGQYYQGRVLTRGDSIAAYRDWLLYSNQGWKLLGNLEELRNKILGCWCFPLPCHGQVLIEALYGNHRR